MKRWRVVVTSSVVAGLVLFLFLVPLPISRIRGQGLVQPAPESASSLYVRYKGVLEKLNVRDGEHVEEGQELAVFGNPELSAKLKEALEKKESSERSRDAFKKLLNETTGDKDRSNINDEISKARKKLSELDGEIQGYERILRDDLVLKAPRSGVVSGVPRMDEVHKMFEMDPTKPFLTIHDPGKLRVCLPVLTLDLNRLKENLERPSRASIKTLRRLQDKVSVYYQDAPLAAVFADLNQKVKGVHLLLDPEAGLSDGIKVTYEAREQRLGTALDKMFEGLGLGYVVVSDEKSDHDGWLKVRPGRERGFPEGQRQFGELDVEVLVPGRDGKTWKGKLTYLPESEAKEIPLQLSSRGGGPVAVKAGGNPNTLIPQTQHYLVYIDLIDTDVAVSSGTLAQVKIFCKPETCAHWVWRKINDIFDLGLL
jgi:hypothetical protein